MTRTDQTDATGPHFDVRISRVAGGPADSLLPAALAACPKPLGDVWRESARHQPLTVTLPRIARPLEGCVAADHLVGRRVDLDDGRITTTASASIRSCTPWLQLPNVASPSDLVNLGAWAGQWVPTLIPAGASDWRRRLLGGASLVGFLAAPLRSSAFTIQLPPVRAP